MSILDSITETRQLAPRITLYGKPGVGKTTLANQFPEPLFLFAENTGLEGLRGIDVSAGFSVVWDTVKQLLALEELPFKTLVIDSLTKLDTFIVDYIIRQEPDPKKTTLSSACGGYGKGFEKAEQLHLAFKQMCDKFQERGITVVYIAHTALVKDRMADTEDYHVHSIEMHHDKSRKVYINDVDAVLFCKLKSMPDTTESGKTILRTTGQRIIVACINDIHVSKNRFNLPSELPMKFEELQKNIPYFNKESKE